MEQILEFLAIELLTWQFWLGVMFGMLLLLLGALLFWLADNARFDREIAAGMYDNLATAPHNPRLADPLDGHRRNPGPPHPWPGRAGADL